jgi:hypothetical protein
MVWRSPGLADGGCEMIAAPPSGVSQEDAMSEVTILFLAANPASARRLSLDEEIRNIDEQTRLPTSVVKWNLQSRWAVRPGDVQRALNETRPAIVHFGGHGAGVSGLLFHATEDDSKFVPASALRPLLGAFRGVIRLVVLNACYSEDQAREVSKEIDCVIGMSRAIGDRAACCFVSGLYMALAHGSSARNAFEQGLARMGIEGEVSDLGVPRLMVRQGVDASAVVFGSNLSMGPIAATRSRDVGLWAGTDDVDPETPREGVVVTFRAALAEVDPGLVRGLTDLLRSRRGQMRLTIDRSDLAEEHRDRVRSDRAGKSVEEVVPLDKRTRSLYLPRSFVMVVMAVVLLLTLPLLTSVRTDSPATFAVGMDPAEVITFR